MSKLTTSVCTTLSGKEPMPFPPLEPIEDVRRPGENIAPRGPALQRLHPAAPLPRRHLEGPDDGVRETALVVRD